jgi:5-methylcytosine-specific restriction endonuclease McrA
MGYKDPDQQRAYQRDWMTARRDQWISEHGPCAQCGSTDRLEVDHVDPGAKSMEPAAIWSLSAAKREAELAKCQVLCHDCHARKSATEAAFGEEHGLAKLTESEVRFIKSVTLSGADLARQLGVTRSTIWDIRHRRTWRHVA